MSNLLLVISICMIISMLVVLNYDSLSNYYMYNAIKNVELAFDPSTPHLDTIRLSVSNRVIPFKDFKLNEDNTLTVSFGGGKSFSDHFGDIEDFSYVHTFNVDQTYAWRCIERSDHTHLEFHKYLGSTIHYNELVILLWHYQGDTKHPISCNYPDIIIDSIDLVDYDYPSIFEVLSYFESDMYEKLVRSVSKNN